MTESQLFHQPTTLEDAWDLLKSGPATARPAWTGPRPRPYDEEDAAAVVDLAKLGLRGVELEGDGNKLLIGSMTPLAEVQNALPVTGLFGGILQRAIRKTAHHGLRNLATLGGVLEDPEGAPEIMAALLACGASIRVFAGSSSRAELAGFLNSDSRPSGLVQGLELDIGEGSVAGADIQWVLRSPMDRALVVSAVCLGLEGGKINWVRTALAADGIHPRRVPALEQELKDQKLGSLKLEGLRRILAAEISAEDSYRAPADYQIEMAIILSQRALRAAAGLEDSNEG